LVVFKFWYKFHFDHSFEPFFLNGNFKIFEKNMQCNNWHAAAQMFAMTVHLAHKIVVHTYLLISRKKYTTSWDAELFAKL
jgi:hypothetical protein